MFLSDNVISLHVIVQSPISYGYFCFSWQVFGDGVVAQTVLSRGANGSALSINWAWGMAVVMGIYFAGGISGKKE